MVNFLFSLQDFYTEGVGQFQPRVELWQPWDQVGDGRGYPERVCSVSEPLQGLMRYWNFFVPGLPKAQPLARICEHLRCWIQFTVVRFGCGCAALCSLCLRFVEFRSPQRHSAAEPQPSLDEVSTVTR